MVADVRARIVELFEIHRSTPGQPYDERHFLDFLLTDPKEKGDLHNSFRGLRRYRHFVEDVQYEFGVCFSIKDWNATYSLDQFVERLTKLQQSRRASLQTLQLQIQDGYGWGLMFVVNSLLVMIGYVFRDISWVLATVFIVAVATNIGIAIHAWRARSYLLRLRARIENN